MTLSERVARLRAPNPSPMTLDGTNAYVVTAGSHERLVIDPGPDDPAHLAALGEIAQAGGAHLTAIVVTHGHPDHYPGALALARTTGAPVFAHPAARFRHDRDLADGERLRFDDATLQIVHAPGHARDHVVLYLEEERALFTGDVVLGTGTTVIAPPGGEMRAYQATLRRLLGEYGGARTIYGGHGPEIRDPVAKLREYLAHRESREAEILAALDAGDATIPAIVARVYAAVDRRVWPAAARQVLAYLQALEREGVVRSEALARQPTGDERALLDPDLSRLAHLDEAETIRAELGYRPGGEPLLRYVRVR